MLTPAPGKPRWYLDIAGRTYSARHLSRIEAARYDRVQRDPRASPSDRRVSVYRALRMAFPWRFSYWLRGDPVHLIREMPATSRAPIIAEVLSHVRPG